MRAPLIILALLACFPANAWAQGSGIYAPDRSEFSLTIKNGQEPVAPPPPPQDANGGAVINVSPASPVMGVPDEAAPMPEGGQPPAPGFPRAPTYQNGFSAPVITPENTASPAAPVTEELPPAEEEEQPTNTVVLQGLNKVTGHISKLEGPIGIVLRFDNLEIITRRCWKSPPDEQPENAALVEIREVKTGEQPKKVYLGWMFSSSPGLSGIEHPVYDVNIIACEFRENPEGEPET
ncbi:MAG: DUF2155 domain-containing protein, partial [Rickettsiales bacterium]|nr:DUF2155 domain-containing protein [Rickettsiales bacterium]